MAISAPAPAPAATYRSVFAVGQFRLLFAGQLAYVVGFGFELLGLSVLVYSRSRSPFLAALAFGVGFAPQVVGGLLFTSLADRLPPRAIITVGLLLRALPGLIIGLVPGVPVWLMLALVAVAATASPVYMAAISRLVPDILAGDSYVLGRAVLSLVVSGSQILSLGIGGAILLVLPPRRLLLAAGCTLVLSAAIRFGLRPGSSRVGSGHSPVTGRLRGTVRATFAGNARLFRDRRVRRLLLIQWLPSWLGTSAESLLVPYAALLGGAPAGPHGAQAGAGPLLASVPVGMVLGDVVVGRLCRPATRERLVTPLRLLIGAPLIVLVGRPPLVLACALLVVSGFGYAYSLGVQQAFLDSVPERLRGQAFGLNTTGLMGGQGLCPAMAGAIASPLGPAAVIAACGVAVLIATALLSIPAPAPSESSRFLSLWQRKSLTFPGRGVGRGRGARR